MSGGSSARTSSSSPLVTCSSRTAKTASMARSLSWRAAPGHSASTPALKLYQSRTFCGARAGFQPS